VAHIRRLCAPEIAMQLQQHIPNLSIEATHQVSPHPLAMHILSVTLACSGACSVSRRAKRARSCHWRWSGWNRCRRRREQRGDDEPVRRCGGPTGCCARRRERSSHGRPGPGARLGGLDAAAAAARDSRRYGAGWRWRAGLDRPGRRTGRRGWAQRRRRGSAQGHGPAAEPAGGACSCALVFQSSRRTERISLSRCPFALHGSHGVCALDRVF
jgi:hypothetical protein